MAQPFLHDHTCVLSAPVQVWSRTDGNVGGHGVEGIYCGDDRVLAVAELAVTSHAFDFATYQCQGSRGEFVWLLRTPGEGADPLVSLTRRRLVAGDGVEEVIVLSSASANTQRIELAVRLVPDSTALSQIKVGAGSPVAPVETGESLSWHWRDDETTITLATDGVASWVGESLTVSWGTDLAPGSSVELRWEARMVDAAAPFVRPGQVSIRPPESTRADVSRLVRHSAADLEALCLAEAGRPDHLFLAAGAPWFFTLFGRDSLMSAIMLAQSNPELALATLRTLAARQGSGIDIGRAEQPGKILHEVRREALDLHDGTVLPSEYYGTIDATCLWVMLLGRLEHLPDAELAEFAEPLVAAMDWIRAHSDTDGDGLLEYFDESGHGLANQGWKDSGDSIRFADGSIAEGPIVLVEVQGYAYAAARVAAALLPRLGRTDAERAAAPFWDDWATAMANRVRERFWVSDELGPYLALALDRRKRPVTGVASNMGHLLGLGILTHEEEALVVQRLMGETMFSGYGIRTLSSTNDAYWPLRYHGGSVWSHDTAWIMAGMRAAGFTDEARTAAEGLLRAAAGFNNRLPELFSGRSAAEVYPPEPYPASCRPQAWAAASAWVVADILG